MVIAQNTIPVEVGGSTIGSTPPYYAPQNVTINVGDIVRWNNVSGTHNVNGTTQLFPGNPESFGSGSTASGAWTYSFTFTIPGVYNYHCTSFGHAATQFGSITVQGSTTGLDEADTADGITLYPVPTDGVLIVDLGDMDIRSADVFSLDGKRMATSAVNGRSRVEVGTEDLAAGNYFLRLIDVNGVVITRPFRKE
jgi:plastocyanin